LFEERNRSINCGQVNGSSSVKLLSIVDLTVDCVSVVEEDDDCKQQSLFDGIRLLLTLVTTEDDDCNNDDDLRTYLLCDEESV